MFFSRLLGLAVFLLGFVSSPAVASSAYISGTVEQKNDCSVAHMTAYTEYNTRRGQLLAANCNIASNTPPICKTLAAVVDCESGDAYGVYWSMGGTGGSDCQNILGYGEGEGEFFGERSYSCTPLPPVLTCPSNSTAEDTLGNLCRCNDGYISYNGTSCEAPKTDPCPAIVAACTASCGAAGDDVNQCNSADGELVGTPYCHCKEPPPPEPDRACNPATGQGCSTSDKQDKQTSLLSGISGNTAGVKESVDGVKGSVDSLKGSITGQLGQTNTLLGQILNSNGVKNAGGGGGGDVNVDTGGIESRLDAIKGSLSGSPSVAPAHEINSGIDLPAAETALAASKTAFEDKIASINQDLKTILDSTVPQNQNQVGHLPCWRNIPLTGGHSFDICFADYEDKFLIVGYYIVGLAYLLAALIILRPEK